MHTPARTFPLSIVVLLALVLTAPTLAAAPQWVPLGPPDGASISAIAFDPTHENIVYASSWGGGVFKSLNGGRTWSASATGLYATQVNALAVDPRNPMWVYAGTTEGFFRSHDGGRNWFHADLKRDVLAIAVDSRRAGGLNIATRNGLFRSTDGGAHWVETSRSLVWDTRFYSPSIVASVSRPRTLYAAYRGYRTGIFRSDDTGKTWYVVSTKEVWTLAVDPGNPDLVYADEWKSEDGGLTWVRLPDRFSALVTIASRPGVVVGLHDGAFAISEDEGRTYRPLAGVGRDLRVLAISPSHPSTWLAGTSGAGMMRSEDGGLSWQASIAGMGGFSASLVRIVPERNAIFAGSGSGLYRSTNGGVRWRRVLPDVPVSSLAVDPSDPDTLYAGGLFGRDSFLYKSTDGGDSWRLLPADLPPGVVNDLIVLPTEPRTVFAAVWLPDYGSYPPGLHRSTDGGESWSQIPGIWEVADLEIDPADPNVIYATQGRGILRSHDRGRTWEGRMVGEGRPGSWARRTRAIAVSPADGSRVAVIDPYSLFLSLDEGRSWHKSRRWGPDLSQSVVFDPVDPDTIYAGLTFGVLRSRDGGANWSFLSRGLPGGVVNELTFDPADPAKLYAATSAGIFVIDLRP
jgi:photosystem II stability/assembly factor-like uncharacterized protein